MIQVQQVSVTIEEKDILQNVSLLLENGNSIGIIGPNGAGKSTLLNVMGGHQIPSSGDVLLYGRSIQNFPKKELARQIAFMQQMINITPQFTAFETVQLARYAFLRRFEMEHKVDQEICQRSMERTCTWHLRDRRMDEVSGGERQRILLAQVLAQEPKLLLLDEPTTFLDLFHQMELLSLLKKEQKTGLTWVAVLHDLNLAAQFCDKLMLLHEGKIVQYGTPTEIFNSSQLENIFQVKITVVEVPGLSVPQIVVSPKSGC